MKKVGQQKNSQFSESFNANRTTGMRLNEFQDHVVRETANAKLKKLTQDEIQKLFDICDGNQDGVLTKKELETAYEWLRPIVDPVNALIVVDVQNDFLSGSLALKNAPAQEDGLEVVPVINKLLKMKDFDAIGYSFDYHPKNHISFLENVASRKLHHSSPIRDASIVKVGDEVIFATNQFGPVPQKIWPTHCVIDTKGAELAKDLTVLTDERCFKVYKGMQPDVESYTAFGNVPLGAETTLNAELKKRKVTEVYVSGVAYDVCVGSTALDALELGYSVAFVEDASRGVTKEGIDQMKKDVIKQGGKFVFSKQVIEGDDITMDDRIATLKRKLARETIAKELKT